MLGKYENIDRRIKEPNLEPVDAVMLTLDAEEYLEKTLDAVYREIPVNKLIVLDGGSKDKTIDIIKKYPRTDIYIKPEIRTTGKGCEFLFKKVSTPWIFFVDCAKVPSEGWYREMQKYKDKYDFFGSKRIVHYEFEREEPRTIDIKARPLGGPWLIRKESIKNYKVDDDFAWREVDIILRQFVERNGYKYGAVPSAQHICYITDQEKYKSDSKKSGTKLVFSRPKVEILNKENWQRRQENAMKSYVKYLDPDLSPYLIDDDILLGLMELDIDWIKKTNIKWYNEIKKFKKKRYRKVKFARAIYNTYKFMIKKLEKIVNEVMVNFKK